MVWIKTTQQLPEGGSAKALYLINTRRNQMYVAYFAGGVWETWHQCCGYFELIDDVVCWMPIPESVTE